MDAVIISMNKAVSILQTIEPTTKDLKNLDYGIPYALHFESSNKYKDKIKAAGRLLRMCLHAIERGEPTELDKLHIPMALAALSGYDQTYKTEGKNRTRVQQELKLKLLGIAKRNPTDTWKQLLNRLEGDEIVLKWDAESITWLDENGDEHTTPVSTF
jgi:hypothetical protein